MHWILLIICCAAVYGGLVTKSSVWMVLFFMVAVASCAGWLWLRYRELFPGGTEVDTGGTGLSDAEMENLRAHVRAHAKQPHSTAPDTLERPADPEAIRRAAERVSERDAEMAQLRLEAERAALALRAAEERRVLEEARERIALADANPAPVVPAVDPIPEVSDRVVPKEALNAPPPETKVVQGPEREVGEEWNPYAGVVQAPKKDVQVHPTSGDAHDA